MSGYIGSTPVPQATQHRESFTCTEGQTTFNTAGYTAQFVDVYLNGSHLSPADFTATNGSDVVLGVAASADDVCDIISYTPFEVAGATFTGTTTTDVSLTTGVLTANGGAVFNEGSVDVDFRVETNGNVNMLFVDGGNDNVGIGVVPTNVSGYTCLDIGADSTGSFIELDSANGMYHRFINNNGQLLIQADQGNSVADSAIIHYVDGAVTHKIDATGAVTMPLQPAFLAYLSATQENLATGSPETTIKFDSEIFDQNSDFTVATGNGQGADNNNLRGAFTAPVTGKYQLNFHFRLNTVQNDINFMYFFIKSSNRNYTNIFEYSGADDAAYYTVTLSVLADMDEDDTAYVNAYQSGGSAETDIEGGTSNASFFSGYLVA